MRQFTGKPLLYLAYNRPEETNRSFSAIRKLGIKKLYIALDGPKSDRSSDFNLCGQVRDIVMQVDWDCKVQYLFRENNMGCRYAVSSALDWFFSQETSGVIVEDDIIMSDDAYAFISILLDRFQEEPRVMMVSACNLLNEYNSGSDYHFSKTGGVWGWGTWRRAWALHDPEMKDWPDIKNSGILYEKLPTDQAAHRTETGDAVYYKGLDSWSYGLTIRRIINDGLAVVPRVNLIDNIGFNDSATHTTRTNPAFEKMKPQTISVLDLNHPAAVEADARYDKMVFDLNKSASKPGAIVHFLKRVKSKLSK